MDASGTFILLKEARSGIAVNEKDEKNAEDQNNQLGPVL